MEKKSKPSVHVWIARITLILSLCVHSLTIPLTRLVTLVMMSNPHVKSGKRDSSAVLMRLIVKTIS